MLEQEVKDRFELIGTWKNRKDDSDSDRYTNTMAYYAMIREAILEAPKYSPDSDKPFDWEEVPTTHQVSDDVVLRLYLAHLILKNPPVRLDEYNRAFTCRRTPRAATIRPQWGPAGRWIDGTVLKLENLALHGGYERFMGEAMSIEKIERTPEFKDWAFGMPKGKKPYREDVRLEGWHAEQRRKLTRNASEPSSIPAPLIEIQQEAAIEDDEADEVDATVTAPVKRAISKVPDSTPRKRRKRATVLLIDLETDEIVPREIKEEEPFRITGVEQGREIITEIRRQTQFYKFLMLLLSDKTIPVQKDMVMAYVEASRLLAESFNHLFSDDKEELHD